MDRGPGPADHGQRDAMLLVVMARKGPPTTGFRKLAEAEKQMDGCSSGVLKKETTLQIHGLQPSASRGLIYVSEL